MEAAQFGRVRQATAVTPIDSATPAADHEILGESLHQEVGRMDEGGPLTLTSADGVRFGAWSMRATPGARRGGLVLLSEIYGLNADLRRQASLFAGLGFEVIAPALFDRLEPGFAVEPQGPGVARAAALARDAGLTLPLPDVATSIACLRAAGPVFVVGFGYGAALAWSAACRLEGISAATLYYGRLDPAEAALRPRCPVIAHFGASDPYVPRAEVEDFARRHAGIAVHLYPAGHGFASQASLGYDETSARRALERTLALFMEHGGGRRNDLGADD